jgi:hypothetical protein
MSGETHAVRILEMGRMEVPGPQVFWMSHWNHWLTLAFNVVLVEGAGVRALVNTGPPDDLGPWRSHVQSVLGERARFERRDDQHLLRQLEALGISRESITHVVITPFTLYSTSGIPWFSNAQICVSKTGWLHFHSTHDHPHDVRSATLSNEILKHLVVDAWDRVRLLDDEDEIAPGLRTWWAGTHHRASLAVEIDTPDGVVVASDAFFYRENVVDNHPLGIGESMAEGLACYERVRNTAAHIVPLNDPSLIETYVDGIVSAGRA